MNARTLHWGILLKWDKCRNVNDDNQCAGGDTSTGRRENVVGMESVVCFFLSNCPASEFYMATFRNTLFHLHRRIGIKDD
jgi:hypothetical protein